MRRVKVIQWEYAIRTLPVSNVPKSDDMQLRLNEYGGLGWELVGIYQLNGNGYRIVFKRPTGFIEI